MRRYGGYSVSWIEMERIVWGFLAVDLVIALLVVGVWLLHRRFMLRRIRPLPTGVARGWAFNFFEGIGWAVLLLVLTLLPGLLAGAWSPGPGWTAFDYAAESSSGWFAAAWTFFLAQSLFEELVFRGLAVGLLALLLYGLIWLGLGRAHRRQPRPSATSRFRRRCWWWSGVAANTLVAFLFAFVHADNPNADLIGVLNVGLAGLVMGQLYWLHGSVIGAWTLHWVWNAALATLGMPVSGLALGPPLLGVGATGARLPLLSGGQFGPEASLAATTALFLVWLALLVETARSVRQPPEEETPPAPDEGPDSPPEPTNDDHEGASGLSSTNAATTLHPARP